VKLVWSRRATREAEHIAERIAKDRPAGALEWLDGLYAAVGRLKEFPFSGHVLPELPRAARREIRYKSHRVIYRLRPDAIEILRVAHGRRDLRPRDPALIVDDG
jgi:toxin ParE1/3/4